MLKRSISLPLLFALGVAACGDDAPSGGDTGTRTDASAPADSGTPPGDTGVSADTGVASDTGVTSDSGVDAGTNTDSGTACDLDMIAPTVTSSPASPISVALGQTTTRFTLQFSEPVTGVAASTTIDNAASISSVNDLGGNAYEVQVANLAAASTYVVTVSTQVADVCGNFLASAFTVTINTATDPCAADVTSPMLTVIPSSPIALAPGTTTTTVTLSFDEPITGLSAGVLSIDNSASVASVTQTMGNDYDVVVTSLIGGTTTLTVPMSIQDVCGNGLAAPVGIVFFVDDQPPQVVSTVPVDQAPAVALTAAVTVNFSEPITAGTGTVSMTAGGTPHAFTMAWTGSSQLQLTPTTPYPYDVDVVVGLVGLEDAFGNAMTLYTFSFHTLSDCTGLPPTVTMDTAPQGIPVAGSSAFVRVTLSSAFPLRQSDFILTPTNGGGGSISGLAGAGTSFTVQLTGVATGDTYDLTTRSRPTPNGCTSLVSDTLSVTILSEVEIPIASGSCPMPPALANHHTATDACNEGTNSTFANSEATGFVLAAQGDALSISGIYDSDSIGGGDNDYFSFSVAESGASLTDIRISIAYGCNFTGTGSRGAYAPIVYLRNASNTLVGSSFNGNNDYNTIDGTGTFGFGLGDFGLAGAAGTNTYHVQIDDDTGSNWCMDYMVYVQVIDTTRPLACLGAPAQVDVVTADSNVYVNTSSLALVGFDLSAPYPVAESDITVTPLNMGSGLLSPGSLVANGSRYDFVLTGGVDGDAYEVLVAASSTTCTTFIPGTFTATLTGSANSSGICPFPAPLANNHVAADACNEGTNGSVANSEATGFTLSNPGDAFSITGIYDSDSINSSDYDFFSFSIAESGTTINDVRVSIVYGCNFTNGGTPPASRPAIDLYDGSGSLITGFDGNDTYSSINGSGGFGFGAANFEIVGPSGTNTYHLRLDDVSGSTWCMDYRYFVELVDNTRLDCRGVQPTVTLLGSSATVFENAGSAPLDILFSAPFKLEEGDLSLVSVSGSGMGAIQMGSLTGTGDTYAVTLTGVANGDVYDLTVTGRTDTCNATLTTSVIRITVSNRTCPLPPTRTSHFPAPDACGQATNTSIANAATTGFTLTNVGDTFSIAGIYDSDGIDFDFFSFDMVGDGSNNYELRVQVAYGCSFTGSGTPGAYAPIVDIRTSGNTRIGNPVNGFFDYNTVNGTGQYGFGDGIVVVPPASNPAGTNTLYLRIDDDVGSGWCMDYIVYVDLVAITP